MGELVDKPLVNGSPVDRVVMEAGPLLADKRFLGIREPEVNASVSRRGDLKPFLKGNSRGPNVLIE